MAKSRGKGKKKAAPTKRTPKLSQTPEAKRSRARRAEARQAAAEAEKKRHKTNAKRRKRRRLERESIRETEAARPPGFGERETAIQWLEKLTPEGASLTITEAEVGARTPWLVVGRIDLAEAVSYAEAHAVLDAWEANFLLELDIGPDRLSQIRIVYNDPNEITSGSFVSNSGPWAALVSDIRNELDPDNPDSLANRYKTTAVPTIYVYFSAQQAQPKRFDDEA